MTSETPWTKGPWIHGDDAVVRHNNRHGYAQPIKLSSGWRDGAWVGDREAIANARLIACAPEFAALAADLLAHVNRSDLDDLDFGRGLAQSGLIDRARTLLARAKGEEQPNTKGST